MVNLLIKNKANQEIKEFVVPKRDDEILPLFEAAEAIVKAVEAKEPPACNVGGSWNCDRCREYTD